VPEMRSKRDRQIALQAIVSMMLCVSVFTVNGVPSVFAEKVSVDEEILSKRIITLISQLGDEHYATRQQAQSELREIGVPAVEYLQSAIYHADPQIANAARYLLRSSFRNWTNEKDPIEVQKLLQNYGIEDYAHREGRLYRLQMLKGDRGLPAILRIARFEVSGRLRRKAAIAILRPRLAKRPDGEPAVSRDVWELILSGTGEGKNDTSHWLSTAASFELGNKPFTPDFWIQTVETEKKLLADKSNETSREALVELTKLASEQLARHSFTQEALDVAKGLLDVRYEKRELLPAGYDKCVWFLRNQFYSLVEVQCQTIEDTQVDCPPPLTYLRAEALQKNGDPENGQKYADIAFSRNNRTDKISTHDRANMGNVLFLQMQYDWAEREYRAALTENPLKIQEELDVIQRLCKLLADGAEHGKAAKVMLPIVQRFESDPIFAKEVDGDSLFRDSPREPGSSDVPFSKIFRSTFLYYQALDKIKRGDLESAKPDLRESFQLFPDNIDVAIAMHQNPDDEVWNDETKKIVDNSLANFREELVRLEKAARTNGPNEIATYRESYATQLNNYAWLLAGTNRDLSTALEASQKSCALDPGKAGSLDTLARCYYKVGNFEEAIKIQKKAIAMEPYLREFKRSQDEFTKAAASKH
jgi:tetratricopeptide (TPR) repeat protein